MSPELDFLGRERGAVDISEVETRGEVFRSVVSGTAAAWFSFAMYHGDLISRTRPRPLGVGRLFLVLAAVFSL